MLRGETPILNYTTNMVRLRKEVRPETGHLPKGNAERRKIEDCERNRGNSLGNSRWLMKPDNTCKNL